MNRAQALESIDPLVDELEEIGRRLDGKVDRETGEFHGGLLHLLAEAEDEWIPHRDACIAELAEGDYKSKQLPGEEKLDALTRKSSPQALEAWKVFRHLQRMTKRLREREERLQTMISARQSQARNPNAQPDRSGLPQHARRRNLREVG